MKINYRVARAKLVAWIQEQLIGPGADKKKERWLADFSIVGMRPSEAFQCAVLFPISEECVDPASEEDESVVSDVVVEDTDSMPGDAEGNRVRYVPPSSCGFSFYVEGNEIRLNVRFWAVRYEISGGHGRQQEKWKRSICTPEDGSTWSISLPVDAARQRIVLEPLGVADPRVRLQAICRPHGIGWLVTLSLANSQRAPVFEEGKQREGVQEREKLCLFECALECRVSAGQVGDYPRAAMSLLSDDDQELAIQYRHKRVLAVGHGAGVDWEIDTKGVITLRTEFMPSNEVPSVTADTGDKKDPTLDLDFLAGIEQGTSAVTERLAEFVSGYKQWIVRQNAESAKLHADDQAPANRIIARMEQALRRMRNGIACLADDRNGNVRRAFAVANRAMALQMRQGRLVSGQPEKTPRWRPFQLGFLLMVLESALDDGHLDRNLVDLIWFPTGGGKTEAYLGLAAFLITWRRLKYGHSGGGTTILMRYTLRLLTGQQFERANRLIFAMEFLRRNESGLGLGEEPITIGMWVGGATTPNKFDDAKDEVTKSQQNGSVSRKLLLSQCPWCGAPFSPNGSFIAAHDRFHFLCQNAKCAFHAGPKVTPLPCNVVDEALYMVPPTLLIGTIDKFARLAWEPRASDFFGGKSYRATEMRCAMLGGH